MGIGGFSGLSLTSVAVSIQAALALIEKSLCCSARRHEAAHVALPRVMFSTLGLQRHNDLHTFSQSSVQHQDLFVATEANKSDERCVLSLALMSTTK